VTTSRSLNVKGNSLKAKGFQLPPLGKKKYLCDSNSFRMPFSKPTHLKLYYTIGEVAEMFGVNVSMIRYYEKEFEVIKPHKNKKGNRLFTQVDVEQFARIFELTRDQGCSLAEAKVQIKAKKQPEMPSVIKTAHKPDEVIQRLKAIRHRLEELLQRMDQ
jgi:DNA-binding transcriptional MerR regulator